MGQLSTCSRGAERSLQHTILANVVIVIISGYGCGTVGVLQPPPPTPDRLLNGPHEFAIGLGGGADVSNSSPLGGLQLQYTLHDSDEAGDKKRRIDGEQVEATGYKAFLLNTSFHNLQRDIEEICEPDPNSQEPACGTRIRLEDSIATTVSLGGRFGRILHDGTLFVGFDLEGSATILLSSEPRLSVLLRLGMPVGIQLTNEMTLYLTPSAVIFPGLLPPAAKMPVGLVLAVDEGIGLTFELDTTFWSPYLATSITFNFGARFR